MLAHSSGPDPSDSGERIMEEIREVRGEKRGGGEESNFKANKMLQLRGPAGRFFYFFPGTSC